MTSVLAIRRETVFSPGKVDADLAILQSTVDRLVEEGLKASVVSGEWVAESGSLDIEGTLILTMAQSEPVLKVLEQSKATVINSPRAIRNCFRSRFLDLAARNGLPIPRSDRCEIDHLADSCRARPFPLWIKRTDYHATERDDVVRVEKFSDLEELATRWKKRGLRDAILQDEAIGTVEKFYAIPSAGFLDGSQELWPWMKTIEESLGLQIFGGDVVWTPTGPVFIDINDWPSFSRCTEKAAEAIATLIRPMILAQRGTS